MPTRICQHRGCTTLTTSGYYCTLHRFEIDKARRNDSRTTGRRGWTPEFRRQRKKALIRDGYRCQLCDTGQELEVHHINGNSDDNRLANLTTLCSTCHHDHERQKAAGRMSTTHQRQKGKHGHQAGDVS